MTDALTAYREQCDKVAALIRAGAGDDLLDPALDEADRLWKAMTEAQRLESDVTGEML